MSARLQHVREVRELVADGIRLTVVRKWYVTRMSVAAPNVSLTPASQFVGDQVSWFRPPKLRSAVTWTAGNTLGLGDSMKRFLLVLPFLLAACDSGVTAPAGVTLRPVIKSGTEGTCTLANGNTAATGFDEYGYNRCAHQFVGTYGSWCEARGQDEDCGGVKGSTKLVMKWNEEWDRGNAENEEDDELPAQDHGHDEGDEQRNYVHYPHIGSPAECMQKIARSGIRVKTVSGTDAPFRSIAPSVQWAFCGLFQGHGTQLDLTD